MTDRKFKEGDKVKLAVGANIVAQECSIDIGTPGVVVLALPSMIKSFPYDVRFEGYNADVPVGEDEIEERED